MTEDDCNAEFRFKKHDIERLCVALAMPDVVETINRLVAPAPEALNILLWRLAYPCRYNVWFQDLEGLFQIYLSYLTIW